MKPTFALDLTRDAVALLHRTPKGWLSVGEVAFDAPDLGEALEYLRKTALGLSPMGMATKIVLPNSQILYTEVEAPGPSRGEKRRQIAKALEGRTPYDVTDLVFDWSGKGATVKVAVVARETLQEAEGFAAGHWLNPVSFVAIPEDGDFVGEPFFGPTEASATILAAGETVEKDREPVSILHRDLPGTAPAASSIEPATAPADAAETALTGTDDTLPGLDDALNADLPLPDPVLPAEAAPYLPEPLTSDLEDMADDLPGGGLPEGMPPAPVAAPVEARVEAAPLEAASKVSAPVETSAKDQSFAAVMEEVEEAPFAHVTDSTAFADGEDDILPVTPGKSLSEAPKGVSDDHDDVPPAPSSAAMVAFASRRAAGNAAPRVGEAAPSTAPSAAARLGAAAAQKPAGGKAFQGLVTAPSIPGTRLKPKAKVGGDVPRPAVAGPTTVKSPARPGGTFGSAAPPRNRTGIVFAVLIGMLLLFLAVIAAWSSLYLSRSASALDETGTGVAAITPDTTVTPDVEDEMLADMQDPEGMTEPLPEAAGEGVAAVDPGAMATEPMPEDPLPAEAALVEDEASVLPETAVAPEAVVPEVEAAAVEPAPEPAPDTTVATDVTAALAPVEDQDEIFLSSMDAPPPALDALALPTPIDTADAVPEPAMPPPAFGTVYKFDANGLLQPTPEGIVSPEGVLLVAGKPPLVPPTRSEVAAAAAAALVVVPPAVAAPIEPDAALVTADPAVEAVPPVVSDPTLEAFRPLPRPEGLNGATADDAQLDTEAAAEFAGLRPLPRPESVLAAASASRPAEVADLGAQGASLTAQAEAQLAAAAALEAQNPSIVAISMRPAARPSDLSDAVEAAVAAAVREPEPEPEVELAAAAPAPELKPEELDEVNEPDTAAAAPKIPTKASVAKQATYANAINLSKINLIGTYGTNSNRYALVRQSNGRYKKVQVGDKIDGGTVKAITETEVRYQKGGKLLSLKMPKA